MTRRPPLAGIGMTSMRTRHRLIQRLRQQGIHDARVLTALESTPRHIFVDEALASHAYENKALPIGHNQTISQPYVVALMTQLLLGEGAPPGRVLEIGTGCGYQTAILAELVREVFSVERIVALQRQAMDHLYHLRRRNIRFHNGDGMQGWAEHAPYDGILVTAAPKAIPEALREQLAEGGRMVIPVGERNLQRLVLVTRVPGGFEEQDRDWVKFVPLVAGRA